MGTLRRYFPLVVLLFCIHLSAQGSTQLRVDESKILFHLLPDTTLDFPIFNALERPLEGTLLIELLNSNDHVDAKQTRSFHAVHGDGMVHVSWQPDKLPAQNAMYLGSWRLRYTLIPQEEGAFEPVSGIVQLGPHIRDGMDLQMLSLGRCAPRCSFWVRVAEPRTGRPWAGVSVDASVSVASDGRNVIKRQAVTNAAGEAVFHFDLPATRDGSFGNLQVTAHRGPFTAGEGHQITWAQAPHLTLTTDKPLYQPGQTVHMRMLAFGFDRRAWEGAGIIVKITDQDRQEQFHSTVVTSKFGVATADWEVPLQMRLGNYAIEAKIDYRFSAESKSEIRISRYDLPSFSVKAEPDRHYYLPGQDATIEVRGDYLFGKPVQRGNVRITEEYRNWSFEGQKWMISASKPLAEGTLDASGKFAAHFNLKQKFEYLETTRHQNPEGVHFEDWWLTVFLTDASTGRTEQRRFAVRLSLDPVHLYVASPNFPSGSERLVYITSSYADGTPASVDGWVAAARPNAEGRFDPFPDPAQATRLGSFHTNSYGVARVVLPTDFLEYAYPRSNEGDFAWYAKAPGLGDDGRRGTKRAFLIIHGADKQGRKGTRLDQVPVSPSEPDFMEISTDRALYRAGEPIRVSITAATVERALIQIRTDTGVLAAARLVNLIQGHGEATFPYVSDFRGLLTLSASTLTARARNYSLIWSSEIIYPAGESLQVGLQMARTTLRPGETASADFHVRTIEGASSPVELGVLVYDRAVEERVRSDQQFGLGYRASPRFYPYYVDNEQSSESIAGISKLDLLNLNPAKPFTQDLQILADAILYRSRRRWSDRAFGQYSSYSQGIDNQALLPVEQALKNIYDADGRYPANESGLRAELKEAGVELDAIRDAWGMPYRPLFVARRENQLLLLVSDGQDKRADSGDDYVAKQFAWPYFRKAGQIIDQVAADYYSETARCFHEYDTLRTEAKKKGIDLSTLPDPWGTAYRYNFKLEGNHCKIEVYSAGPERKFYEPNYTWNAVKEWTSSVQFFVQETTDLERALDEHYFLSGQFPTKQEELEPVLAAARLTPDRMVDPWGKPYYYNFYSQDRSWDRVEIRAYTEYQGRPRKKAQITPVTQKVGNIAISSVSSSGGGAVARFNRVISEQGSKDVHAVMTPLQAPRSRETGGLSGNVTSMDGTALGGAQVVATSSTTGEQKTVSADGHGAYSFSGLPVGTYVLEFSRVEYHSLVVNQVPVLQGSTTKLDAQLEVKTMNELAADKTEGGIGYSARNDNMAMLVTGQNTGDIVSTDHYNRNTPMFTPRLRQYFPETLLWRPEVITDDQGNARIEFPMGDSITAWKMSIVASNQAGELGAAEKELRTFQPFLIEDDPPKVFTQGDRISLPLTIRNYSDHAQSVTAEMKPQPWATITSSPTQLVTVAPQSDGAAIFSFVAQSPIRAGFHEVTAGNQETGDAVKREVSVHPDGQKISLSTAKLLAASDDTLEITIPENTIPGSADMELRLYPNMMAQVLDALHTLDSETVSWCPEGLAARGYVHLLVLELLKKAGQDNSDPGNPRAALAASARKAVQDAHRALAGMQRKDGGYDYCFYQPKRSPIGSTAYVLRFLNAASGLVPSEGKSVSEAEKYLARQQRRSGAWLDYDWRQDKEVEDANMTAFVARTLAEGAAIRKDKEREDWERPLKLAMSYLEDMIGSWNDAYLVGNYAVAGAVSGHADYIERAQELLRDLAHTEGGTTYWNLEANTSPFCTWGRVGRLEATALAVKALALLESRNHNPETALEMNRGIEFLLSHKDSRATWYQELVTHNVIEAIVAAMPGGESEAPSEANVSINGHAISTIQLPAGNALVGPATVELAQYLQKGVNRVQISRPGNLSVLNTVAFISYYIPWKNSPATTEENFLPGESRALKFSVHFDPSNPEAGKPVHCRVETERIGFHGYGMLKAEIGLPPGADVDRESIDVIRTVPVWGWMITPDVLRAAPVFSYEILPDRVVLYLWPVVGGSKFEFQFRLRYPIDALTAPSVLYDYYNPESTAAVPPVRFTSAPVSTAQINDKEQH
jgi:Alpha-2-macroglobulin family/Carboxypeptidase regulatory-like domain/MG2 domain/A-macroglobulin TED domain